MRRVLAVVAGVLVGYTIYFASVFVIIQPIQQGSGESPEEWLGVAYYLLMPFGLCAGGVLTGYLSQTIPSPRWLLAALHAPGLYTFLVILPSLLNAIPSFQLFMVIAGVIWLAISTLGVLIGAKWHARSRSAV